MEQVKHTPGPWEIFEGDSLADDLRKIQLEIMGQHFAGSWWNRQK